MAETASRPLSSLALMGVPPPSRTGTSGGTLTASGNRSRTATGTARTATSGKNASDLLAQSLVLRMRTYFKDVATDVKRQELISQEVIGFMNRFKNNSMKEEDVAILQERIRLKLQGLTEDRNSLAVAKRELVANDDWAKIFHFQAATGRLDEDNERTILREKQRLFKETLTRQVGERKARIKEERDEDYEYFVQEQDALKKWEKEEEEKRRLQQEIIEKLRQDRQKQLSERVARRELLQETKRQEEEQATSRLAYETKADFEKELQARSQARLAAKEFLLLNETNKALRAERKQKEAEEDARYRREWAEQLDKQERTRNELVERTRRIQNQQAERAKTLPESKVWMDPALIERYYRESEERKNREEEERARRVKEAAVATTRHLNVQVEDHHRVKAAQREEESRRAEEIYRKVAEGERQERERRAAERSKKDRFRADLESQMRKNAQDRLRAPMSEAERALNRRLLGSIADWNQSGVIEPSYLRTTRTLEKLSLSVPNGGRVGTASAKGSVSARMPTATRSS